MSKQQGYLVEQWGEHEIRVTESGVFFVENEGKRVEAKTLEGLKKKIGGPPVTLKAKAVLFESYSWPDEEGKNYKVIDIYGISALGNILYTVAGHKEKEKAGRRDDVRVFDQAKLDARTRLQKEIKRLNGEMEDLMEKWPHLERPKEEDR